MEFSTGTIYEAKEIYDPDNETYCFYSPAVEVTGEMSVFDCWVVNSKGELHPGYSASPVPVHRDNLGASIDVLDGMYAIAYFKDGRIPILVCARDECALDSAIEAGCEAINVSPESVSHYISLSIW